MEIEDGITPILSYDSQVWKNEDQQTRNLDLDSTRIQMDALGHTPTPFWYLALPPLFPATESWNTYR